MEKNQLIFRCWWRSNKEKVSSAFKLILSDQNVKGILINIFVIMRCDVLAQGVVEAAKEINLSIPLVVRLAGTNFKKVKSDKSNLQIVSASDLNDAAKKIVEKLNNVSFSKQKYKSYLSGLIGTHGTFHSEQALA